MVNVLGKLYFDNNKLVLFIKIVEAILKSSEQFGSKGLLNQMLEQDFQGNNPLHAAAEGEYVETVKFLLETWKKASKKCGTNMIKSTDNIERMRIYGLSFVTWRG